MTAGIFTAHSDQTYTAGAVAELASSMPLETADFVLFFHGPNHVGESFRQALQALPIGTCYGCSTSGEITPQGYRNDSIAALCFDRGSFTHVARRINGLKDFGFGQARELAISMQWELRQKAPQSSNASSFALLLIDSLSQAEEFVAAALGSELGNIHLMGASAGDNWQLQRTPVLYHGEFVDDSAVVLLVHSELEFRHYNFHNFVPSDKRGVITAATPSERLVHEINGVVAAREYARMCGLPANMLDQERLARHPAIITVGDRAYPRGFLQILDDGSLRCACAIDEGVVFRLAEQVDYAQQLQQTFARMRQDLGNHLLVMGFECAARRQLVEQYRLQEAVFREFAEANVWGFSCMGEQSNTLNMNNSFNCLVFRQP